MSRHVIELPFPKPPLTANDNHGNYHVKARTVRYIRETVTTLAKAAHLPAGSHIEVTLHYRPRDNRRRDADNLWPTLKAVCDALSRGRRDWVGLELVPDDTPEHMTKHTPVIHPGRPNVGSSARMWIELDITP